MNMKWAAILTAILPLAVASGFTRAEYASGEVMDLMMQGKEVDTAPASVLLMC